MKPATWILLGSFAVAAYLVTSAQRRAAEAARASKRTTGELVGGLVGGVVGASPVDLLSGAGAWLRDKFSGESGSPPPPNYVMARSGEPRNFWEE